MRINTNIASLQAQQQLVRTTRAFQRALERLASGRRINSARDDAAGLAIAEGLRSQVRGLSQVARNINDAFGLLQTVDGVLDGQLQIVQRMRELAVQSSTGTLSISDRSNLDIEFQSLLSEFDRVAAQANFNGLNLLDGSLTSLSIQVGNQKGETIDLSIGDSRSPQIFTQVQGTGTFSKVSCAGSGSAWIKGGDFNNDGSIDYIHRRNNSIFARLNDGEDNFTLSESLSFLGNQTGNESTTVGDFNGDGNLDFFVGSTAGATSLLYLGDGTGHFSIGQTINEDYHEVDSADINGDGIDDLVSLSIGSGKIGVRLGQSNGNFAIPVSINPVPGIDITTLSNTLGGFNTVCLDDFTGDGIIDLAYQNYEVGEILEGQGDGTFISVKTFALSDTNGGWTSGDFDEDGVADLAFSGALDLETSIYLNEGLQFRDTGVAAADFYDLAGTADLNSDGHIDILTNSGTWLKGNGHGDFDLEGGTPISEIDWVDVNGDDILDLFSTATTDLRIQESAEFSAEQPLSIDSQEAARRMLQILTNAIENIVSQRANIGAQMSRLESAENVSLLTKENLAQAQSQIMDADIAFETGELAKQQILQQAAVSVLSQANVSLQIVLTLLR